MQPRVPADSGHKPRLVTAQMHCKYPNVSIRFVSYGLIYEPQETFWTATKIIRYLFLFPFPFLFILNFKKHDEAAIYKIESLSKLKNWRFNYAD